MSGRLDDNVIIQDAEKSLLRKLAGFNAMKDQNTGLIYLELVIIAAPTLVWLRLPDE